MNTLSRFKLRIAQVLCQPVVGQSIKWAFHDSVPNSGIRIDTKSPFITNYNAASIFWGLHEKDEVAFVKQFLPENIDVIELGSSIGVVSAHISKKLAYNKQLICIEANSNLIELIRRNVTQNSSGKQATVINIAIDYSGLQYIDIYIDHNNLGSHVLNHSNPTSATVKTTTLAKLVEQYKLKEFALVCDIEGAEAGMIVEERSTLANCQQMIIELHKTCYKKEEYSVEDLCHLLKDKHGFKLIARRNAVHVFKQL